MCKSDFGEEFPIFYDVGKSFSSSGSKQDGLKRTESLLQGLGDQGCGVAGLRKGDWRLERWKPVRKGRLPDYSVKKFCIMLRQLDRGGER